MATKNSVSNYQQEFYIDGVKVPGIFSINGSYNISEEPINIIGKGFTYPLRQGPMIGDFNIQKYYVGRELFLDYIDDTPIEGSINYENKNFGFNSGYLTEYSLSAGIGQIPTSNVGITVYGDIGAGIDAIGALPPPDLEIVNQGSIQLNLGPLATNRVVNFNYNLRIERTPLYKIGSIIPVQVDRNFPMLQELSVEIEVFDYEVDNLYSYLDSPKQSNITLSLKNPINNTIIETFNILNAHLLNNAISSNVDGVLRVSLSYIGYINRSDRLYS